MPVYEYWDEERQVTIELRKPVAERDLVPANLRRVTVPKRLAIHGTSGDPVDEQSAVGQVPKALKSLSNNEVNAMCKEGGMSVDTFKRAWGMGSHESQSRKQKAEIDP